MSKKAVTPKQIIALCGVFLAVILAVSAIVTVIKRQDSFPLLEINGQKISREEFSWALYAGRDSVLSAHASGGISPIRWKEETALGMPYEMVAQEAVQLLREYYAVVTLAQERGYLADISFAGLKAQLEEENRQRAEAMSAGEIFTGLTGYDLKQYITYRADALRRQFCDDTTNPEMQVTEDEILRRYEADKDRLYRIEDSLELRYLAVNTWEMSDDSLAALRMDAESLRQQVIAGGSLDTALVQMPHLQEFYQEISIDGSSYAMYARSHGDILAFSAELKSGDISQVIEMDGGMYLIECVSRKANGCQSLDAVRSVVVQTIRQDRYHALIAERREESAVLCDWDALFRYTADTLG